MSTILVNTLTGTSTAGSIAVTGEGNSTTTNLQQGLAKVWANYEQEGTHSTRDSFNVSSLTDAAQGRTTINFTNSMVNDDFCAVMYLNATSGTGAVANFSNNFVGGLCLRATGSVTSEGYASSAYADSGQADTLVTGDLA